MIPKNITEAKALMARYREVTNDEIKAVRRNDIRFGKGIPCKLLERLTGFGQKYTCTLCKSERISGCGWCFYPIITGAVCYSGDNKETFHNIRYAKNVRDLLRAYKRRAKHIEALLHKINE